MDKPINWEERRFLAAVQILSGMCANYHNTFPSAYRAEDAANLADALCAILSDPNFPSIKPQLYNND